ncbi:Flagellar M-ring protein [Candidatus Magnetomoraceae bacterium gMMP-15]
MNAFIKQFVTAFKAMPLSRKITVIGVLGLVIAGFILMFFWANQVDYQPLYTNLSPDDAGEIVAKLKEQHISYKITGEGSIILVPAEKVYETRMTLASDGLPRGDSVGFEVFDETNFSTTEFVQKLNYQRALQGELARTISQFEEVEHARVLLVIPEESLFVEDVKPPSASVLVKLRSSLSSGKVEGIVHLVASAVEGLETDNVTVVDTKGKILFKGTDDTDETFTQRQHEYPRKLEKDLANHIQTMLERILGKGKAIVRVSADVDFDQVDLSEETYDPDSIAVRSRQRKTELSQKSAAKGLEPGKTAETSEQDAINKGQKEDEIVNYEVSRTSKRITRPFGIIKRLSVAAVVDGKYEIVSGPDGANIRKYIPRTMLELQELEEIVKKAMGYSGDREDQIKISSMAFPIADEEFFAESDVSWLVQGRPYIKPLLNLILVMLIFFFVVRPFLKSFKPMAPPEAETAMLEGEERKLELPEPGAEKEEKGEEKEMEGGLPDISEISMKERVIMIANNHPEQTESFIRGWLNEVEDVAKSD